MQITQWKKRAMAALPEAFATRRGAADRDQQAVQAALYEEIGRLKVALDWLKKKHEWSTAKRRAAVDPTHPTLSVSRQCALLDVPRSSFYYRPRPISAADLLVMRALDEIYTATPFYGSRRLQVMLERRGLPVNRKRVQRLMRVMGLEAVGPKPRLSRPHPEHRVYPYLLRDVAIERVNQVWSTDITYIRLRSGFV